MSYFRHQHLSAIKGTYDAAELLVLYETDLAENARLRYPASQEKTKEHVE